MILRIKNLRIARVYLFIKNERSLTLRVVLDRGQPEGHVRTRGRQHHILGIELDALDRRRVVPTQDAHLVASVRVPDVYPAID